MSHTDSVVRVFDRRWQRFVALYPFGASLHGGRPIYVSFAAWLALSAALELAPGSFGSFGTARAAEPAPSGGNKLPDLAAQKGGPSYNFTANGSGANFERRDADSRLTTHVESSQRTGSAIGIVGGMALGEAAALGGGFSYGAHKQEFFVNLGWTIDAVQRLILTGSQLRQNLDFDFPSGRARADLVQNAAGISYRMALSGSALDHLEFNAYRANTRSTDLGAINYAIDSATLLELWSDPRRIAGGRVEGLQGRSGLVPWQGGRFDFGLGHERLRYDLLGGAETHSRGTAQFEIGQALSADTRLKFGADGGAAQTRYSLGLDLAVDAGKLGIAFNAVRGRDGAPNDNRVQLSWMLPLGRSRQATSTPLKVGAGNTAAGGLSAAAAPLLDQVAQRPSWIPSQVIARLDKTAALTRLIAVDKTALPAGSSVNTATGAITTPLGVAVTGIAGVTKNLALFANAGQFNLSGNSLVINPGLIVQPAVGIVDSYVVTVNNLGGGTTLVTVLVSHGSVKIDSIAIASDDVTAPTTTAAPFVSGTTASATTLSVTINENGTGYYLVQAAAAAAPNVAAVQAGTAFAMTANVAATPAISGLTASTSYKIYFVAKDAANNVQAAVQNVAVTTGAVADVTAPTTTAAPSVSGTTASATTLSVTIDENGTGYYLVQAAAAAAPNVAAVQAGTAFAMTANVAATPTISGLTASTSYKIYFVAKDAANNVQAAVQSVAVTTGAAADIAPPTTTAGPAISIVATDTTASVTQTINENGTGYYLVLAAPAAAPTVAAVKAGTSFAMTAATPAVVSLTGLTASTAYKYYFVAKDAANNDQAAVSSRLAITTTGDVTPPATPATLTLTGNAGASAGLTNTQSLTLAVAAVADPSGVSWFVSESSSAPAVGAGGWSGTQPTSFTLSAGDGAKNVYVYVKDNVGNVQATGKSAAITLDTVAPSITAESYFSPVFGGSPLLCLCVAGGTGTGTITFDETVASVTSISFKKTADNTAAGGAISVSGGLATTILNISFTAPTLLGEDVYIQLVVKDVAGNSRTVTTTSDTLF